jgi:hypothetical protein
LDQVRVKMSARHDPRAAVRLSNAIDVEFTFEVRRELDCAAREHTIAGVFPPITSSTAAGSSQRSIMVRVPSIAPLALAAMLASCASYVTPGRGADMQLFRPTNETEQSIAQLLERKPLAQFPTTLAIVRVQAPEYRSYSTRNTSGGGGYTVLTRRDIETDEDIARIAALPQVRTTVAVTQLLVPSELSGPEELRKVAAQLHADMLLVYTLDTVFEAADHGGPVTVVTLGILPTTVESVDTTASAVVLDMRTGYLYGTAEASSRDSYVTSAWWTQAAIDASRKKTEHEAFAKLLAEFDTTWRGIVAEYAPPAAPGATSASPR